LKTLKIIATAFWFLMLISGTLFGLEFLLFITQKQSSVWLIIIFIYQILTIEAEIYFFEKIVQTIWWRNIGRIIKDAFDKILLYLLQYFRRKRSLILSSDSKNQSQKILYYNKILHYIRKFQYPAMTLSCAIIHLSKAGVLWYIYNKNTLPYGRLFFYTGCLIRVIIEYLILKGILIIVT
jgi:hypothetical protein